MKKMIFFILAVLIAGTQLLAQTDNINYSGSLLWKISGNNIKQPSYVFGTHHLYPISSLDCFVDVNRAFALCEQMVGELIATDMNRLAFELQKMGMMPKDTTWKMLLSEEDYRFVDKQLMELVGFGLNAFGMFKPALASLTYSGAFYKKLFPQMSSNEVIDVWFQQQAVDKGIPVIGLETVQDQIAALFDVSSLQLQANNLVCMLRNIGWMKLNAEKMNHLYSIADLKGLYENMFSGEDPCPYSSTEQIALNKTRNERWLEKLPTIIAEKPSFIAVGAGHLFGEEGLLKGLEKIGFIVESFP
ncbi:MAG: TraB/GumN family protein [Bacteroidales bacterium]|jgi:uncharacterized protein YbaP (TraB family)|nr:TraB/GumN family protein [Bacteroidales bacterium]